MPRRQPPTARKPHLPPGEGREERIALRLHASEVQALERLRDAHTPRLSLSAAVRMAMAAGIKQLGQSKENV